MKTSQILQIAGEAAKIYPSGVPTTAWGVIHGEPYEDWGPVLRAVKDAHPEAVG